MTTQTIDGVLVSRELLGRLLAVSGTADHARARNELRALLDAPAKDPCVEAIEHLERFKEVARSGDVSGIVDMGAELIGMAYFDNQEAGKNVESANTTVHGGDGRCGSDGDCVLEHAVAAQPQGEPVANPVLAYADSYRAMQRQGAETVSIWSVITDLERNIAPLYAEQPAPVAVVRCSFCDVTDQAGNPWSGGSATQDGILIYRVIGCKDHKHLADACLAEVTRLNPSL